MQPSPCLSSIKPGTSYVSRSSNAPATVVYVGKHGAGCLSMVADICFPPRCAARHACIRIAAADPESSAVRAESGHVRAGSQLQGGDRCIKIVLCAPRTLSQANTTNVVHGSLNVDHVARAQQWDTQCHQSFICCVTLASNKENAFRIRTQCPQQWSHVETSVLEVVNLAVLPPMRSYYADSLLARTSRDPTMLYNGMIITWPSWDQSVFLTISSLHTCRSRAY